MTVKRDLEGFFISIKVETLFADEATFQVLLYLKSQTYKMTYTTHSSYLVSTSPCGPSEQIALRMFFSSGMYMAVQDLNEYPLHVRLLLWASFKGKSGKDALRAMIIYPLPASK